MTKPFFERVAVVGAGTMGSGIAQTFAAFGSKVALVDVNECALSRGISAIEASLARLVKKGVVAESDSKATLGRIAPSKDLATLREEALVVEAIVEKGEIKRSVFEKLDRQLAPATILVAATTRGTPAAWGCAAAARFRRAPRRHAQ
jgi:3-hydroxyacyl-CoA dehydrogenase